MQKSNNHNSTNMDQSNVSSRSRKLRIREIQAQSVLIKSKLPESDYCINPYLGCVHGCKYCYARFLGRWRGHGSEEWGSYLDIRVNAPEILEHELSKHPPKGIVLLGSMTDAYQQPERKYCLSRKILNLLAKHHMAVSILTKSDLVLRDIDILSAIVNCEVGLTITFMDENIRKRFEPLASSTEKRLHALRILKEAGIKTYGFIGPIFPELTDYETILRRIAGTVDHVMGEALNLRCGNWADVEPCLREFCPNLVEKYRSIVKTSEYWDKVEEHFKRVCKELNINVTGFYRHERERL